ncbi:6-pyruvoyl trahydropterin synthase family protein [Streptomyces sp. CoH17]|uniref:6-pyruvoyl trahydropterin synthase family protein n=1 Tax=Streptomyces sp. CoH17 TaxID=2992806 RepID=UPI0022713F6D|nr:6-carboxytetrahydropterin synthase [Streptomyces sp. CoH17]
MTVEQSIEVHHNAEIGHRLSQQEGKCLGIHGHGLQIHLTIWGEIDEKGFLGGLDFTDVKKTFRKYIDTVYDHHLLLNEEDPWASPQVRMYSDGDLSNESLTLPGLVKVPGDPTIENLARWIGEWAEENFGLNGGIHVRVDETRTNGATWSKRP